MNRLATILTTAAMATGAGYAALAQETMVDPEALTCAQFMAMTPEQQTMAMTSFQDGSMSATTGQSSEDAVDNSATSSTDATGGPDDSTGGSAGIGPDADVTALQTACVGQDTMLVKDLFMEM